MADFKFSAALPFLLAVLLLPLQVFSQRSASIERRLSPRALQTFVARQSSDIEFIPRNLSSLVSEANENPLTLAEKLRIISTASRIAAEINPHRFLQLNLLKVDIVQDFAVYSAKLQTPEFVSQTNVEFHEDMTEIFQRMDDKHTMYLKPKPLSKALAVLLFDVKDFFVDGDVTKNGRMRRRYVASMDEEIPFENDNFGTGSEILAWNGEKIDRVVRRLGRESTGSNKAAQIAAGMVRLTLRILQIDSIPFSKSVEVTFRNIDGAVETVTVPWIFVQFETELPMLISRRFIPHPPGGSSGVQTRRMLRSATSLRRNNFWKSHQGFRTVRTVTDWRKEIEVDEKFVNVFSANIITTQVGDIGWLLLPSFISDVTSELVDEMSRVLRLMPEAGLVIDIRDNLGGQPEYVKAVLELISDKDVPPQPMSIRASDLMAELFKQKLGNVPQIIKNYINTFRTKAFRTARKVGEAFTGPAGDLYTLLKPRNAVLARQKQVYFGPVVTVYNGNTVSAGDLFVAVQVDQTRSLVVGTSDNSAAAGAEAILFSTLQLAFPGVLRALAGGVDFLTSFARFYRTGTQAGAIIENFGIKPPIRYYPTLNDTVFGDRDLFEFLGRLLIPKAR